ncbi:MAG: hypothetical protein RR576_08185 [Oscillospiraceae bacterium]
MILQRLWNTVVLHYPTGGAEPPPLQRVWNTVVLQYPTLARRRDSARNNQ